MKLRVAIGQINPTVGDLAGNAAKVISAINVAGEQHCDLLLLPELVLSGYPPEDLLLKPSFVTECLRTLNRVARSTGQTIVIVGVPRLQGSRLYNAAAIMQGGRIQGYYHKMLLPNYGVFDEERYFEAGVRPMMLVLDGITVGVSICEDIWDAYGPTRVQCAAGADVLANISASPYHARKGQDRIEMLRRRARSRGVFVCYANLVGGQDELVFDGQSTVLAPDGRLLLRGRPFAEEILFADLDIRPSGKRQARELDWLEMHGVVSQRKRKLPKRRRYPELSRVAEIYEALLLGLSDYVAKNGFQKVVLGLSGGVDSALTACLAVDALGRKNVTALGMPSPYSSPATQTDAVRVAENLGIRLIGVPIGEVVTRYVEELELALGEDLPSLAVENIQARVRGNLLMAVSNAYGWLVLSTGNKSETAVGYTTLYGDMAGGLAVLKDVPKTLVYRLARYRNRLSARPPIPESVLRRAPSAELRPGQYDQELLPPYAVLDRILEHYVEKDRSLDEIVARGFDRDIVAEVIQMVDRNEYKRRQGPPGIKITPRAFGKDRRMPITNVFRQK